MVDAASKIAANERHRGETMLGFPGQQHVDRHFAPGNCVLGCTKVTLTGDCSMSVLTPLEWTQRPLRVKSRPHGITQTLCPLYLPKRTNSRRFDMSALCQSRLNAPQQKYRHVGAAVRNHMNPGLRGRYCAQFPKSCVDKSTIGNVMRIPCSTAMLRATSLVPGRNADTCEEPVFAAKCSAVLNAAPRIFGSATLSGPT